MDTVWAWPWTIVSVATLVLVGWVVYCLFVLAKRREINNLSVEQFRNDPELRMDEDLDVRTTIGELGMVQMGGPVYRRSSGELYGRLNEAFHVSVELSDDAKNWVGGGCAEKLDPQEVVHIAFPGTSSTAC